MGAADFSDDAADVAVVPPIATADIVADVAAANALSLLQSKFVAVPFGAQVVDAKVDFVVLCC